MIVPLILTKFDLHNRSSSYVHSDISFNNYIKQLAFSIVVVSSADATECRLKLVIREFGILLFVAEVLLVKFSISWVYVNACAIYVQPLGCSVPNGNAESLRAICV